MFSRIYLKPVELENDSKRFRRRLYGYFSAHVSDYGIKTDIANDITSELGVSVPWNNGYSFSQFFENAELRDVLDAITIIYRNIKGRHYSSLAEMWQKDIKRAIAEEGISYSLDDDCIVHYLVDEEFELNRVSTLSKLGNSRYKAVLAAYENAHKKLDKDPMDTKGAVRDMFESLEILCKLISNKNDSLDEKFVRTHIKSIANRTYSSVNPSAVSFSDKLLEGFMDWVNAGHKYRHGQKSEEPEIPPVELTFSYLSLGATYIRLLIDLEEMKAN